MLVSIVLGMGVPTVAAYLVAAAAAGPALVKLGVPLLSAHMFIFYYAVLATMTPPVAASAFAAGALAEAHPMQVGFMAVRLGIAAYIVPFLFVYGDSLPDARLLGRNRLSGGHGSFRRLRPGAVRH